MKTRPLVVSLFMLLLILFPVTAQDDAPPTIAILRLGSLVSLDITEGAILDLLESYGFISAEENRILEERRNHQGESINIVWGDAGFDLPTVNFMVEHALDHEVDVLVTLNAPVALVAVNATLDMEDPPVVLFTSVSQSLRKRHRCCFLHQARIMLPGPSRLPPTNTRCHSCACKTRI